MNIDERIQKGLDSIRLLGQRFESISGASRKFNAAALSFSAANLAITTMSACLKIEEQIHEVAKLSELTTNQAAELVTRIPISVEEMIIRLKQGDKKALGFVAYYKKSI